MFTLSLLKLQLVTSSPAKHGGDYLSVVYREYQQNLSGVFVFSRDKPNDNFICIWPSGKRQMSLVTLERKRQLINCGSPTQLIAVSLTWSVQLPYGRNTLTNQ